MLHLPLQRIWLVSDMRHYRGTLRGVLKHVIGSCAIQSRRTVEGNEANLDGVTFRECLLNKLTSTIHSEHTLKEFLK